MNYPMIAEEIGRPVRAIIVDDEALGRQLVRQLVDHSPHIDGVGEYSGGLEALADMATANPDVVFLDIKMPSVDGLSVARRILGSDVLVVFVTAFEAHALEAFEVNAFDYLLKPIDKDRFRQVAERIFSHVRRARLEYAVQTYALEQNGSAEPVAQRAGNLCRIKVREGDIIRYLDPDGIFWFEAANQYVRIHSEKGTFLVSTESLNSLQRKVDPDKFIRVHRSSIININYARRIRVDRNSAYFIEMENGDRVRVSRSKRHSLSQMGI